MIVQQHKHAWIVTVLKCAIKYSADEMQFVNRITVIMRDAIVWMVIVVIRWLLASDQSVQRTKIVHSIWPVWTNAVKIHVIALRALSVALKII